MSEPHTHAPSIADTFARKYGPLPGYAWGAIAVAAVVLFAYLRQRGVKGSTTSPDALNSVSDPLGSDPSGSSTGDGSTQPASAATTNGQWGNNAVNYLVGTGSNAIDASDAIYSYLNRRQLTSADAVLVNRAISELGPPPEGLLPIQVAAFPVRSENPPPTPTTQPLNESTYYDPSTGKWVNTDSGLPAPPVSAPDPVNPLLPPGIPLGPDGKPLPNVAQTYIAQPGDTYARISQKFYGNANHAVRLADANNNQPVMPGLKVVL